MIISIGMAWLVKTPHSRKGIVAEIGTSLPWPRLGRNAKSLRTVVRITYGALQEFRKIMVFF